MCVFGGSRAVSPLSISGISEVRANTSSELRAAPGMPRDVAGLARTADGTQPKALLAPYPAEEMTCWPVSPRVGNVKNNHPSLIEPIAGAGWARRIGWPMEAMSWHRWLATLLVMRALAACAKGARPRLHTRHTRWRMCTTGAVTASGQTVACSGQGQSDPAGPALNPRRLASPPERESARRTGKGINRGIGRKRQFGCLING